MSITFSYINYLSDASPILISSEQVAFPAINVLNPFRSKSWRTGVGQITGQYIEFDLGFQQAPRSFFLTNEQRGIQLSPQATIRVKGCNDGNFTTPESNVLITWDSQLITKFSNSEFGNCRFYRLELEDANNIENYLEIGNLFLGESISFSSTDLNLGWEYAIIDDSEKTLSDGGEAWFDQKAQKRRYNFDLLYMSQDERNALEDLFADVGQHKPFYIALDPDKKITTLDSELAIYCRFTSELKFTNPFYKLYNTSLTVEEVV